MWIKEEKAEISENLENKDSELHYQNLQEMTQVILRRKALNIDINKQER